MKNIDLKKILKYLIIFTILCIILFYANSLNVKAETITIGAPQYTIYQNNGTSHTYTASSIDFWGKDFWRGASNFGVVSSDVSFDTQEFFYNNSNWCVGKSLNVSGYITGVYDFFANGGTVQVFNNNKAMTCTYARENSSLVKYSCVGDGGGSFKIAMYRNNASFSYDTGISKSIELSCDDTLSNVIENDKNNTNSIIDNQNKNNEELKDTIDGSLNNCHYNYYNTYISLSNFTYSNGVFTQIDADTRTDLQWKIQAFNNSSYVKNLTSKSNNSLTRQSLNFTKDSSFNRILFGLNGSKTDSTITFDVSKLKNGTTYTLSFNLLNATQGSISISDLMVSDNGYTTYIPSGDKKCTSKLDDTNKNLNDLNDNITNSDSSNAKNDANNFFSNFQTDTFGLTSIITAPLNLISSLTSKTCSPLNLPLPFINKNLPLPCLSTIYSEYFGSFLIIYQTITFGIVAYWVCVRIFNLVKDFKNPDHDEIEVMDL